MLYVLKNLTIYSFCFLVTTSLFSSSQAEPTKSAKTIVIRAQKSVKAPLLSPSYERITADKIASLQFQRVNDVLQQTVGINVVQSGPVGQISSVFIRGTNANHILVRIDGMRANSPDSANGGFDFSDLTIDGLGAVEILRGAASSLFGADAVGGVINIQSQKGGGALRKTVTTEISSTPSESLKAGLQGDYQQVNFSLNASVFHTSGLVVTPDYLHLSKGHYPRLPFTLQNFIFRGGRKINDQTEVTLFSRLNEASLSYQNELAPVPQHRRQILNRLQVDHASSANWSHQLGVGLFSTSSESGAGQPGFSTSEGQRIAANWHQKVQLHSSYQIQTTVEIEQESFHANFAEILSTAQQQQLGLAVLQQWAPLEQLILEVALRQDWSNRFHTPPCYRFGLREKVPTTKTELFINYGTAFKAPSLFRLYGKTAYYNGNRDLQTERVDSYELGIKQPLSPQIDATLIYFHNNLRQLIEYDLPARKDMNIAKARTKGLESILSVATTATTKVEFNHTLTLTRNQITGQSLVRRPQQKIVVRGIYDNKSLQFITEWLFVGKRLDFQAQPPYQKIKNNAYNTVAIKVNYNLDSGWILSGRVENLLNKKIEEPFGYSQARMTGYVALKAIF